ncbi:MAG TPA: protein kinase [Thermoanaerobaculia bacterium]|nr:protein kinase [Thermoanaerobaculia bacterium]
MTRDPGSDATRDDLARRGEDVRSGEREPAHGRRTVGPYRLERRLGAGGMGEVWSAHDERLGRRVALKQILPGTDDRRLRDRFVREARSAARLNHPAIIQIYDILEHEGVTWLVLELAEGTPLDRLLADGPLSLLQAVALGADIAGGLAAAHEKRIVHRDLKPGNVVVGTDGRAKILDFGLAKTIAGPDADTRLTLEGVAVGSPPSMSPEQAMGDPVSFPSDLFSFGVLLYRLVAGVSPFEGATRMDTLTNVCVKHPPPVIELRPEVPAELSRLIERLLEKRAEDRPSSAAAVAEALDELLREVRGGADAATLEMDHVPRSSAGGPSSGSATGTRAAERRRVTVVCGELVSSAGGPLDPEVLYEWVPALHERVGRAIEAYQGRLVEAQGSQVVVAFGYPVAHEDDARRAVLTALELARGPQRGAGSEGASVALRLAVHTGPAVATSEGAESRLLLGATYDAAAALKLHAPPGGVVIGVATRNLVASAFELEDAGGLDASLSGLESTAIFRVLRERDPAAEPETSESPSLLIGRARELELLESRWRLAREGHGQVILVTGEAGIGKSRLLQHLRCLLRGEHATWLEMSGVAYHQGSPLHPVVELLRRTFVAERGTAAVAAAVEQELERLGLPVAEHAPVLLELIGHDAEERYGASTLLPTGRRARTFEAIASLLLEQAARRPLALAVEDLHWLDPSTLELLGMLVEHAPAAPLLLVMTSRPEAEPPWGRLAAATQIHLERLTADEARELVARLAGRSPLPAAVTASLVQQADGVPLFVEELTRHVLESGDRAWASSGVPATLVDSLNARLDRLGEPRLVAQLGSVIGRRFDFALIASVAPFSRPKLIDLLDQLVEAGVLLRRGVSTERAAFTFRHALIQDAAYESLLTSERRQLHRDIARKLEEEFPDRWDRQVELLARHVEMGGNAERAIELWTAAGRTAARRSANVEASAHYRSALRLLAETPRSEIRDRRELDLLVALGRALTAAAHYSAPEVEETYRRAWELSRDAEDSAERLAALTGMWTLHLNLGRRREFHELTPEVAEAARRLEHPFFACAGDALLGYRAFYFGEFEEALARLQPSHALRRRDGSLRHGAEQILFYRAWTLWFLGFPQQALDAIETVTRELSGYELGQALGTGLQIARERREPERAEALARRLLELAIEQSFGGWEAHARIGLGWALAHGAGERADREAGLAELARGFEQLDALRQRSQHGYYLSYLAEALLELGRFERVAGVVGEALHDSRNGVDAFFEAELMRLEARLEAHQGRGADAVALLRRAREIAQRQGARSLELRALVDLSRLLEAAPEDPAHAGLCELRAQFTEGFATPDLRAADAQIERLDGGRR